jgi:hypothetical protein
MPKISGQVTQRMQRAVVRDVMVVEDKALPALPLVTREACSWFQGNRSECRLQGGKSRWDAGRPRSNSRAGFA